MKLGQFYLEQTQINLYDNEIQRVETELSELQSAVEADEAIADLRVAGWGCRCVGKIVFAVAVWG